MGRRGVSHAREGLHCHEAQGKAMLGDIEVLRVAASDLRQASCESASRRAIRSCSSAT